MNGQDLNPKKKKAKDLKKELNRARNYIMHKGTMMWNEKAQQIG